MGTKVWFYIDMQHAHDILPVYNYCKYASRQVQGCPFTPRIPSVALFLHDLNYFWTFYCCCFLNFLPLFIILLISIIFFRFLFYLFYAFLPDSNDDADWDSEVNVLIMTVNSTDNSHNLHMDFNDASTCQKFIWADLGIGPTCFP